MAQQTTGKSITINVNGRDHVVDAPPDSMLLYALRDNLGLRGPKFGCGLSECGACTVIMNGDAVHSCIMPLAAAEDGLFPSIFAKVRGKNRTPIWGLVISSVLLTGLMLMNYTKGLVSAFTFVILLATLTTLVGLAVRAAVARSSGSSASVSRTGASKLSFM